MKKIALYLCVLCFVWSCGDDPAPVVTFPVVNTTTADAVSAKEMWISSHVVQLGDDPITDHGFIYSTSAITTDSDGEKISLGATSEIGVFSAKIDNLIKATPYFIRSFVRTDDHVSLGASATVTTRNTNTWFEFPPKNPDSDNIPSFWGKPVVLNGLGYVGFGTGLGESGNTIIPVYEYDPTTNALTKLPDCPLTASTYTARFGIRNGLYVVNGQTREVAKFDVVARTWKQLALFPKRISAISTFILYNQAFVIGNSDSSIDLEMWRYNEVQDEWELFSSWPEVIQPTLHGVMTIKDKVYLVTAIPGYPMRMYEYDPLQDKYTELGAPPLPAPNGAVGYSYALEFSATSSLGYFVQRQPYLMWRYNADDDSWTTFDIPSQYTELCVFPLNGELYSLSGYLFRNIIE